VLETGGGAGDEVTPSGKFPAPAKGKSKPAASEMDDLIER